MFRTTSNYVKQYQTTSNNILVKTIGYIFGMLLLIIGVSSLMLSITGVNYSFLSFLNQMDGTLSLLIRISMVIGGILLLFIASTNWERERADLAEQARWDETPTDR